ncbi:Rab family GTPase [Fulvivirgaceae bacterium BMA10]|uniref:Rab family GTPase n=1 Tax=Splendidivirga corallicola TaxID=3051826 RepID=A0ABT8KUM4_9BACT|nr:Rab family GTPase [Fulvivirgaceae bacterium BMA10]
MDITKKVVLIGKFGVGKTSLVQRFVHQKFSDEYLTTIGVKIDKKIVEINGKKLSMLIWDIAGESSHQKIPSSYKLGAQGIFYVFDLTRPSTFGDMSVELNELENILSGVPIKIVGNKKDLISPESFDALRKQLSPNILYCSAKTGENVEKAFYELGTEMLA